MWRFESYIKNHKIALMNSCECLAEQYENIDYWTLYRDKRGWGDKRLFKLYEHLPAHLRKVIQGSYWYGEWKSIIDQYDVVIVNNVLRGRDVIEYIQSYNPHARIIVYFESKLDDDDRKNPRFYNGLKNLEFFTFDKNDSQRYGIPFVRLYYDPAYFGPLSLPLSEIKKKAAQNGIQQEVYYAGRVHDRLDRLMKVREILETQGISHKLFILKNFHRHYGKSYEKYLSNQKIAYSEILQNVMQSRCILEIPQKGQRGMTYRAMEAAIYHKKLITDNKYATDYEFYTPERVFILGVDPIDKLKEFVQQDCPWGDEKADVSMYTPEYWLDKVLFGGEIPDVEGT